MQQAISPISRLNGSAAELMVQSTTERSPSVYDGKKWNGLKSVRGLNTVAPEFSGRERVPTEVHPTHHCLINVLA